MNIQIKQMRKARGITQKELAARLDASVRQVGYWEKGRLTLEDAYRIADVFGCTLDELAGRQWHPKASAATDPERKVLACYRSCNAQGRAEMESFAEYQATRHPLNQGASEAV